MFPKLFNIRHIKFSNIKNIFIFFFVISLIFSRFLADAFVVIGALFFIYLVIKNNIKTKSIIFSSLLIFSIYLIINSFFSEVPLVSIKSTLPYARFILFISFFLIYFSDKYSLKILLYSILFVYIILLIDAIFQINSGFNLFGYPLDTSGRASSFFGRHLILGSFVSKTFAIVVFLIFYINIKHKYIFYLSSVFVTALLVYVSKERSSLFFYLIILFFSFFSIEKKYFFKIILIVIFKLFLLTILYPKPLDRLYFHTKSQLFSENKNLSIFSYRHELHYITALRIFMKFPILGGGVNSFRYLCDKEPYSTNDIIKNNIKNSIYSKEDSYFYYLKTHDLINFKNSHLLILFKKEYFEMNNIDIYSSDKILELIKKDTAGYYFYNIIPSHLLTPINYKNFDFIEKGSLLYKSYEFQNGCNTHPHHLFIQILAETGIVGFVFLLIFYLFIFRSLYMRLFKFITIGKNTKDLIIYAYYFTFFLPLTPSGNFFNNYYSILLYLPLTFLILSQRK
jgi:O-antigen ligase